MRLMRAANGDIGAWFNTPYEILDSLPQEASEQMLREIRRSPRWHGLPYEDPVEKFYDFLNGGDDESVVRYKTSQCRIAKKPKAKSEYRKAFSDGGTEFHIGKYINGESFMSRRKQVPSKGKMRSKNVTVAVCIAENCGVDADEIRLRCTTAMTAVKELQRGGYNVRLICYWTAVDLFKGWNNEKFVMAFPAKDFSDPLVPPLVLPFCSAYFFRAIVSALSDTAFLPKYDWSLIGLNKAPTVSHCVGRSCDLSVVSNEIRKALHIDDDSAIIFDRGECLCESTAKDKLRSLGFEPISSKN